jgi:hypothetical protein
MTKFVVARVLLTSKEYEHFKQAAPLTGPGTISAAIREKLGFHATPRGWVKSAPLTSAGKAWDALESEENPEEVS